MSDAAKTRPPARFRFSLASLLLVVTLIGLIIGQFVAQRNTRQVLEESDRC